MAANDLRGWVMSAVSGVACVLGSAVICADIVLRRVTHDKSFQIANSNNFLSASLCLSAGVMLFTSLYSMLPNSKDYLTRAGFSPSVSAYILTALFIAGVVVIRVVSGFLHRFIPSHVVDCAHTHDGPEEDPERGEQMQDCDDRHDTLHNNGSTERTPLLRPSGIQPSKSTPQALQRTGLSSSPRRRESLRAAISRRFSSLMGGVKPLCDENGPCYGFSQTCGRECTKVLASISPPPTMTADEVIRPELPPQSKSIEVQLRSDVPDEQEPSIDSVETAANTGYFGAVSSEDVNHSTSAFSSSSHTRKMHPEHTNHSLINHSHHNHHHDSHHNHSHHGDHSSRGPASSKQGDPTHHHHVPQNAFLSIGLQTSLAIALHKLPEGFITYATNHASPTLGLTVFLALFIHNIVEGFAMALPLYLALNSRWKAMFWSSLLGGISQPAGAGIAALWIWGSGHTGHDSTGPSWGVYGGMFAMTAGVMTSVALQLFSEGLGLTHHRGMGIGFAVAGMGLMGFSFALTA
ncbi:Zinc-regulated transporter 3 [Penicillium rolfsii]|nr:Zinc-regulated transporter 3 [Penicillium rolfsii]